MAWGILEVRLLRSLKLVKILNELSLYQKQGQDGGERESRPAQTTSLNGSQYSLALLTNLFK